jgi:DNA (cytosine-5)-methyltransferase 1
MVQSTLYRLGYAVEWRVINAADYGFPQRRRRTFMLAYHESTEIFQNMRRAVRAPSSSWFDGSVLTRAFPGMLKNPFSAAAPALRVRNEPFAEQLFYTPLSTGKSRFENAGVMLDGEVWTARATATGLDDYTEFTGYTQSVTLGDVVRKTGAVPTSFYVPNEAVSRWVACKSAKRVPRTKAGFDYEYAEGSMAFPDRVDRAARTVITSEGGTTPSRTKHVIEDPSGRLRRLTPEELEELNGFPRGFTAEAGVGDVTRAMLMGNALAVGLVTRIGEALFHAHVASRKL